MTTTDVIARINGVALNSSQENLPPEQLRQRACTELLRQAAQAAGLLSSDDVASADGVISEAACAAMESLLERELKVPDPDAEACRRHYAAHEGSYCTGERVHARHILLAVTPGVDVVALRKHAEMIFLEARCHDGSSGDGFAEAARKWSNCPSAERDGDLGWLEASDCAPEFARELFGRNEVGVLHQLVHSRFGLHIVEVLERVAGTLQPFEAVRGAVAMSLRQQAFVTAMRQYISVLAQEAQVEGITLEAAQSPLVQ